VVDRGSSKLHEALSIHVYLEQFETNKCPHVHSKIYIDVNLDDDKIYQNYNSIDYFSRSAQYHFATVLSLLIEMI
jgi:hypothetical protein